MATIMYSTGNGYYCGCCRRTDTDTFYFDSEDIQYAIDECISIAKGADWDFSIDQIFEFTHETMDASDLESRIEEEVKKAEKRHKHQAEIDRITRKIKEIDWWFDNLEQTKASKTSEREKLQAKLAELGA